MYVLEDRRLTKNQKRKQKKKRHRDKLRKSQSIAPPSNKEFTVDVVGDDRTARDVEQDQEIMVENVKSFFDALWEVYERQRK